MTKQHMPLPDDAPRAILEVAGAQHFTLNAGTAVSLVAAKHIVDQIM